MWEYFVCRSDRDYQDEEFRSLRKSRSRDREHRRSRMSSPGYEQSNSSASGREWDRGKTRHSSRRSPSPRREREPDFRDHVNVMLTKMLIEVPSGMLDGSYLAR